MIASIAKRDGRLWSVLGCMGADGQPQIHLQLYSAMIDHGLDIQEAIEMPRFLSGRFGLGEARDTLHLEGRFPDDAVHALAQRGHLFNRWGAWNEMAGHAHGITIDPRSTILAGGADPRSDGAAIGYYMRSAALLYRQQRWVIFAQPLIVHPELLTIRAKGMSTRKGDVT